jgi:hypothetical protein
LRSITNYRYVFVWPPVTENEVVAKDRKLEKLRASESSSDSTLKQAQKSIADQQSAIEVRQKNVCRSFLACVRVVAM